MLEDSAEAAVTAWARAWHSDRSPVSRWQQTGDRIHLLADVLAPPADARGQARQLLKRWPRSRQRSHRYRHERPDEAALEIQCSTSSLSSSRVYWMMFGGRSAKRRARGARDFTEKTALDRRARRGMVRSRTAIAAKTSEAFRISTSAYSTFEEPELHQGDILDPFHIAAHESIRPVLLELVQRLLLVSWELVDVAEEVIAQSLAIDARELLPRGRPFDKTATSPIAAF